MIRYKSIDGKIIETTDAGDWMKPPVYEVIRLIEGTPLFFDDHMARMGHSLELVGADYDFDPKVIYKTISELSKLEDLKNQNIRIEIGLDPKGEWSRHVYFVPSFYPDETTYKEGVQTVTTVIVRKDPHAKVVNPDYLRHIGTVKSDTGAYEVIIMDEDEKIAEGSRSNLFFIKGKKLYSAKSQDILMGITRIKILELARALGIEIIEKDLYLKDISEFEGCFLSGTSIHILPIRQIDEHTFSSATLDVVNQLQNGLHEKVSSQLEETKGAYENDAY